MSVGVSRVLVGVKKLAVRGNKGTGGGNKPAGRDTNGGFENKDRSLLLVRLIHIS